MCIRDRTRTHNPKVLGSSPAPGSVFTKCLCIFHVLSEHIRAVLPILGHRGTNPSMHENVASQSRNSLDRLGQWPACPANSISTILHCIESDIIHYTHTIHVYFLLCTKIITFHKQSSIYISCQFTNSQRGIFYALLINSHFIFISWLSSKHHFIMHHKRPLDSFSIYTHFLIVSIQSLLIHFLRGNSNLLL